MLNHKGKFKLLNGFITEDITNYFSNCGLNHAINGVRNTIVKPVLAAKNVIAKLLIFQLFHLIFRLVFPICYAIKYTRHMDINSLSILNKILVYNGLSSFQPMNTKAFFQMLQLNPRKEIIQTNCI